MIFKQLTFIVFLGQLSIILPFSYDVKSHIFKRSKFLQYLSTIVAASITVSCFFSIVIWVLLASKEENFISSIDFLCLSFSWFTSVIVGCLLVYDRLLKSEIFIDLANSLLKTEEYFKFGNMKFFYKLTIECFLEIIVFPFFHILINIVFFSYYFISVSSIVYCTLISICVIWIHVSIVPIRLLFNYFELILSKINSSLQLISNSKESSNNKIDFYSQIYSNIYNNIQFINNHYGLHIIIYFFGISFAIVFLSYRAIDMLILKVGFMSLNLNSLNYIFIAYNGIIAMKSTSLLFLSISRLLNEAYNINVVLNNCLNVPLNNEVRQKVC